MTLLVVLLAVVVLGVGTLTWLTDTLRHRGRARERHLARDLNYDPRLHRMHAALHADQSERDAQGD